MPREFDIDYEILVRTLLPVDIRTEEDEAWLNALVSGVDTLHGDFAAKRRDDLYGLGINGEVCKLEKVLNDVFDNGSRRIYIDDPEYFDPIYVFQDDEDKPVYVATDGELPVVGYDAPVYAFQDEEVYSGGGLQFKVMVPADITLTAAVLGRMQALINLYRLVSKKNYTITSF